MQHLKIVLLLLQKIDLEMDYWRSKLYAYMKKQSSVSCPKINALHLCLFLHILLFNTF